MKLKIAGGLSWFLFLLLAVGLWQGIGGRIGGILAGLAPFLFLVPIRLGIFKLFRVEDPWFSKKEKTRKEEGN